MCGLVGLIQNDTKNYPDKRKLFDMLLFLDTVRGVDGTGIYFAQSFQDEPEVIKRAYPAPDFIQLSLYKDAVWDINKYQYIIGHNRAATKGGVSHATSHPFVEDHITLVHNGTLRDTNGMPSRPVDSQSLTAKLAQVDDPIPVLEDVNGAYALIWHDHKKECLYIAKNDERPLHYAETELGKVIASEKKMLEWVLDRLNVKVYGTVKAFDDLKLYKFWESKKGNLTFSSTPYESKVVTSTSYSNYYGGHASYTKPSEFFKEMPFKKGDKIICSPIKWEPYPGIQTNGKLLLSWDEDKSLEVNCYSISKGDYETYFEDAESIEVTITDGYMAGNSKRLSAKNPVAIEWVEEEETKEEDTTNVVPFRDSKESYTKKEFERLTEDGCCMCGDPIFWGDRDSVDWLQGYSTPAPICPACVKTLEGNSKTYN